MGFKFVYNQYSKIFPYLGEEETKLGASVFVCTVYCVVISIHIAGFKYSDLLLWIMSIWFWSSIVVFILKRHISSLIKFNLQNIKRNEV